MACEISVSVAFADQSARFSCSVTLHRYLRMLSSCSCVVFPAIDGYASVKDPIMRHSLPLKPAPD